MSFVDSICIIFPQRQKIHSLLSVQRDGRIYSCLSFTIINLRSNVMYMGLNMATCPQKDSIDGVCHADKVQSMDGRDTKQCGTKTNSTASLPAISCDDDVPLVNLRIRLNNSTNKTRMVNPPPWSVVPSSLDQFSTAELTKSMNKSKVDTIYRGRACKCRLQE